MKSVIPAQARVVRPRGRHVSTVKVRVGVCHNCEAESNCVGPRGRGEQLEAKCRSVGTNSIRRGAAASLRFQGEIRKIAGHAGVVSEAIVQAAPRGWAGSYDMAVTSWSNTGAPNPQCIQIAMEEIKTEEKLKALPDTARAFDWSMVQKQWLGQSTEAITNLGSSSGEASPGLKI